MYLSVDWCVWCRWEWVTGGLAGAWGAGGAEAAGERGDCKLPRRKLHKKLLNHMHDIESVRRAVRLSFQRSQLG